MRIKKSTNEEDVIMDINTTPLIDVMLVLLVMLIITIPVQLHSVNLNMPTPNDHKSERQPQIVIIEIDPNGSISWNSQKLNDERDLQKNYLKLAELTDPPEIHIKPNQHTPYKYFAHVIAEAQRNKLTKIGVIGNENYMN